MTYIERHWYRPKQYLSILLTPLEKLFGLLIYLRRLAYRRGWLNSSGVGVPIVVIGNIHVGGAGKTPLTIALLQALQARSIKVGVVSRGYRGQQPGPLLVHNGMSAQEVGDEALLLCETGAPVVIGRDRVRAARLLRTLYPDLDLILSDDGLQHYRMARAIEIVVLDTQRYVKRTRLLPNGPLREPYTRLREVDAIVINGSHKNNLPELASANQPVFIMRLAAGCCYRLGDKSQVVEVSYFTGKRVIAVAGIGFPERFFDMLRQLGIQLERTIAFPDHHFFTDSDIPSDVDVIMTAKDAVKLQDSNHARLWVLPVQADVTPDLVEWLLVCLKKKNGH